MTLTDIIANTRVLLSDVTTDPRWNDTFFTREFQYAVNEIYDYDPSIFYSGTTITKLASYGLLNVLPFIVQYIIWHTQITLYC